MRTVEIAGRRLAAIGYGCMGLSQSYEPCNRKQAVMVLNTVLDMGYDHLDTAALYGFGANEELLREAVGHRRREYFLASKCGLFKDAEGIREINGHPDVIRRTCEDSLKRLGTDHIDLYYLHRKDPVVPIQDSVGELRRLKEEGHIGAIGLSEVAPDTLENAMSEAPIAALQSEYSLWTRHPEGKIMELCVDNDIALVAYSPLGRGFFCNHLMQNSDLVDKDIRRSMPRFQPEHLAVNHSVLSRLIKYCSSQEIPVSEGALAWLLAQGENIVPIPGTRSVERARANFVASDLELSDEVLKQIGAILSPDTISGERYNDKILREVDSEKHRYVD